ncbi:MAG: hypothetical protein IGQ88_11320 [Gloeomargaritaceae cyanobacterium C42_A2020_066]|nr:hypothetical protein [Gloeomargaritaceae cyanobacterium C42_A2020_066]
MAHHPYDHDPSPLPDCFELLSAYLDGEVTPAERQTVERLLATDLEIRRFYDKLRRVHTHLQSLDERDQPAVHTSPEALVDGVITAVTTRTRRRLAWTGAMVAVASLVAGVVSGWQTRPAVQLATQPTPEQLAALPPVPPTLTTPAPPDTPVTPLTGLPTLTGNAEPKEPELGSGLGVSLGTTETRPAAVNSASTASDPEGETLMLVLNRPPVQIPQQLLKP